MRTKCGDKEEHTMSTWSGWSNGSGSISVGLGDRGASDGSSGPRSTGLTDTYVPVADKVAAETIDAGVPGKQLRIRNVGACSYAKASISGLDIVDLARLRQAYRLTAYQVRAIWKKLVQDNQSSCGDIARA